MGRKGKKGKKRLTRGPGKATKREKKTGQPFSWRGSAGLVARVQPCKNEIEREAGPTLCRGSVRKAKKGCRF